jgi:PAS domain S-box-containing protein
MTTPRGTVHGVAEAIVPAVAVIDAEGTVIGWTHAAQELLGYRAADILNRSGAVFLTSDDRATRISAWAERFADQEHWSDLAEARHRDGSALLLRLEGSRLRTPDGTTAWLLSAIPACTDQPGDWVLEPLIRHSPVAVRVWDTGLRCIWLNETARRLQRAHFGCRVDGPPAEVVPGFAGEAMKTALRQVLAAGDPVIDREFRWTSADHSEDRTFSMSLFRLDGADGRPLGVCSLAIDITNSQARQRLALLIEANARIGSTLDVRKCAQELADLPVPVLADYVTVDLAESVLPEEEPLQRLAGTDASIPVFRRAGMASIHEELPEALWPRGAAVFVPPSSPFTEVLSSGRSHFEAVLDTSPGTWLDQDPDRVEIIRNTRMHTLIIVPLKARGDILGIVVFVRTDNPAPFTADDLMLAEELVARAALSLDNARRYTRERTAALALQRHLLPHKLSGGGAVDVASRYLPSDIHEGVGGDWYDTIPLSGSRIAVVVGDVTGHGINAAATMGRLRTAVRTLAYLDLPPDKLLAHLDNLVVRLNEQDSGADGNPLVDMGATCLYGVYDPATRRCTMVAAGHPPPAIVDPTGAVAFADLPSGTPIGLGVGAYESRELELAAGTLIVLYTDGLIETREADIDAGMERLRAALAQTHALPLEHLCDRVIDTMVADGSEDDIALLVARTLINP